MKHCFLYLFHLFVVSNSCNLSSFGLALEFPSNKKQVCGQSECQQAQMYDVNRLDMYRLTFYFVFLFFCYLLRLLCPMSYFSPSPIYPSSLFVVPSCLSSLSSLLSLSIFLHSLLPFFTFSSLYFTPHPLKARTPGPCPQHTVGFLSERLCLTGYLNE